MNILGLNLTTTSTGLRLDDGSAVLLQNGVPVVAIAEERLNRSKHSGGVAASVRYCLDTVGAELDDVDVIAVTSCCDTPPTPEGAACALANEGLTVSPERIAACPSHHLAHAASAFFASGFETAVVVVADNEGNILGRRTGADYWQNSLERTSTWRCRIGWNRHAPAMDLLERHGDRPGELSLGAAYNYFTKWLGLRSYHEAGQTMALAAYATGLFPPGRLFQWHDDRLVCTLEQDHEDKPAAVRRWFQGVHGVDIGPGRSPSWDADDMQREVAGLAQAELEAALVQTVRRAVETTGVTKVCLAGGVALNCVANTRILRDLALDDLFVQPASSDVGQSLGVALWAQHCRQRSAGAWRMTHAGLGRSWPDHQVRSAVEPLRPAGWTARRSVDAAADAAELLARGAIVGWHQGGAEYGPRALGQRSILADPRDPATKPRLDHEIKRRAPYRPYAPSVLAEQASEWFDVRDGENVPGSPLDFMLLAVDVRHERRCLVPAVVHVDGTARVHLVRHTTNPRFHRLIRWFTELTGVPLVLNTSFNPAGSPIVETPQDSVDGFLTMGLDVLVIEDWIVTRQEPSTS